MKMIIKQYLASLRERGELDVILPDLLSELGFVVFSRPGIGTRQYGVDVAAVGVDEDGARKVFLFSVKGGDLKRAHWDDGVQALRPSLNEIRDYYIPTRIPKRYRSLPMVICICFGGDMDESIRGQVEGYFGQNSSTTVSYQEWNGDRLADLVVSGVLRERSLPEGAHTKLRKSIAMVDEPEVSFRYFRALVASLIDACPDTKKARLTVTRQLTLALWTLFVWARDADNYEAAYLCSEHAVLRVWAFIAPEIEGKSKVVRELMSALDNLIALHRLVATTFLQKRVVPHADKLHGVTASIPSDANLDKNLKMFDLLGRLAVHGLWLHYLAIQNAWKPNAANAGREAEEALVALARLVRNNPILNTPIMDSQAIDLLLAFVLLHAGGLSDFLREWVQELSSAFVFSYRTHGKYPCMHHDYRLLLSHPQSTDEYRKEATQGSILLPVLAAWAAGHGDDATLKHLQKFASDDFAHSTLQLWYPGEDSDPLIYESDEGHGIAVTGVKIETAPEGLLKPIRDECEATDYFSKMSAMRWGVWPMLLMACRHNRVPVPPQLWGILQAPETPEVKSDAAS